MSIADGETSSVYPSTNTPRVCDVLVISRDRMAEK
jgi:hypothetical protein